MTKSNRVEIVGFECANEFGIIVNQRKFEAPGPGYKLIKFERDGGKLWIHESRFRRVNAL